MINVCTMLTILFVVVQKYQQYNVDVNFCLLCQTFTVSIANIAPHYIIIIREECLCLFACLCR